VHDEKYWPGRRFLEVYERSLRDPEAFWAEEARKLDWSRPWDKVLDWQPPFARWFAGGRLNACEQCVDRHVRTWRKSKVAIYWEGEDGETRVLSYSTLYREVNRFASVLRRLGVGLGDRVALYLPMVPELPIFMLACARIGAVHTVVFSGFSAQALADRINDTQAKVVITADAGFRRGKTIPLKATVDKALELSSTIEHVIVVDRADTEPPMVEGRDLRLDDLLMDAEKSVPPEQVEATHPLYILYTSGTTGKPKGVVHSTGGYMVYNHSVHQWVFNMKEESVYWCTADVGWVTGHSALVYAPLSHGAAIVIYEGAPDYPTLDRWWEIIEKYGVTTFYTSPTAIRMFMQHGEEWPARHDLTSLELLGSVGEPINPEAWLWYYRNIGGERCPIVDTWWQTETGGFMISAAPGIELLPLKPGAAGLPLPGVDAAVLDEGGQPVPPGTKGMLVIRKPWPGMLATIYGDRERYEKQYWSRYPGLFYTGDYATVDEEGYYRILGRADEVLKVAGHRLGSLEIENAAVAHPAVAEAAAVGVPDPVKGEAAVIFAVLMDGYEPSDALKAALSDHVRESLGAFAAPKAVYLVRMLPKTRSGKIMRRVLRAVASGEAVGDVTTLEDEASVDEVKRAHAALAREV
jgi:acetyl-CoA synthetase